MVSLSRSQKFYVSGLIALTVMAISAIRIPGHFIDGMSYSPIQPWGALGFLCYLFTLLCIFGCYKCITQLENSCSKCKQRPIVINIIIIGWIVAIMSGIVPAL